MRRADLEHLLHAAGAIAADHEIVVIGSQAILGQYPPAPPELLASVEADLYPRNHPERADLIDGSLGEGSPFHETFGYYAHGIGPETAVLPAGWQQRWVSIENANTSGVRGLCLEIHDLLLSKYVAGREKDLDFTRQAILHDLARRDVLEERVVAMPLTSELRTLVEARIARDFSASGGAQR
jgi:hypothetical protein